MTYLQYRQFEHTTDAQDVAKQNAVWIIIAASIPDFYDKLNRTLFWAALKA